MTCRRQFGSVYGCGCGWISPRCRTRFGAWVHFVHHRARCGSGISPFRSKVTRV